MRHLERAGVGSRADWIANIVLYVPLAFLGCVWILGMREVSAAQHLALLLVFSICLTVAVAVEFTQIFFAPRTVSINDLIAETLGSLAGILLWALGRWRIMQLRDAFLQGGRQSVLAVIAIYGLGYVALSLFPYDFVISIEELSWRLESDNLGWLIATDCADWVRCGAHLAGDAIAIAPMGLLLLLTAPQASLRRIFVAGLIFGLVLECMQLFLASGTSQGLSVVMRGLGLAGGAAIGQLLLRTGPVPLARLIWQATPLLVVPYLLLLALLGGWFSAPWLPLGEALARLADIRLMPFYYHYFSTEPAAMASLLANATMYGPVGLAFWARAARHSGLSVWPCPSNWANCWSHPNILTSRIC
jgi:glycopeptide antibiotics resistance protein